MGRRDLMDRSVFNFESSDADGDDDCVDRFSFFEALRRQRSQLKQVELNSGRNAIQPLKNLALINKKVICVGVGDESAGTDYDLAKCYDKLLPNITKQLEESPDTYPAQEIAWPHLLEGGSAIIIDPSDNLADLVYLPVVCTHVEKRKMNQECKGPLAIIICKTQNRCADIAKRCISFSTDGFMASCSVCTIYEKQGSKPNQLPQSCKIFITTTAYILRHGLAHLRSCDSVQHLIFDGLDHSVSKKQFRGIVRSLKAAPIQVIITSKFWRSVLTEIQNCDKRIDDFLIIGSPLDVAIAADAKFDILLTKRSSGNKLKLILEKIESIQAEKFVIICNDHRDLDEMVAELERVKIDSDCVQRNRENDELYKFEYAGKDVYFCIHRMLMHPSIDASAVSYYFVYKLFSSAADQAEIECLCPQFSQILKPVSESPSPVTIAFFCNFDEKSRTTGLSKYFINYEMAVRCRRFWSHVSTNNLVAAIRNHLRI